MKVITEPGVLPNSERYFSTPSALSRQLFFYITRCGHYYCDHNFYFIDSCDTAKLESHKTFLIDYIRKGTMQVEVDGRTFTAEAGQVILTDCRKPHHFYSTDSLERIWIHFDGANSREFFNQIIAFHGGRQVFTPYAESKTEGTMTDLITSLKDGICTEAELSQKIYALLCNLLIPPTVTSENQPNPITRTLIYINEHLFDNLSIQSLASHAGLSPSHFSRQFRSRTGFSPHEYIVLKRIDEAKMLLHSTNLSIKEIAFHTGYRSEVNFITSFTNKVGISPSTFRGIR